MIRVYITQQVVVLWHHSCLVGTSGQRAELGGRVRALWLAEQRYVYICQLQVAHMWQLSERVCVCVCVCDAAASCRCCPLLSAPLLGMMVLWTSGCVMTTSLWEHRGGGKSAQLPRYGSFTSCPPCFIHSRGGCVCISHRTTVFFFLLLLLIVCTNLCKTALSETLQQLWHISVFYRLVESKVSVWINMYSCSVFWHADFHTCGSLRWTS